jgi:hypothetical protein
MLNIEPGLFNLLIYLTENPDEVKCADQKTLLKENYRKLACRLS